MDIRAASIIGMIGEIGKGAFASNHNADVFETQELIHFLKLTLLNFQPIR